MAQLNLDGLSRDEQIAAAAQYSGVPEAIVRTQWQVESSQGRNVNSEAGARGDFQVMPSTQAALEVRNGKKYNPYDFSDSLNMYAQLMKENLTRSKGDLGTAVAMYHGGTDTANWGPRTQDYVQKVTGAAYDGGGVNLPANGYSWKGADIEAAWRGDPIPDTRQLALDAAKASSGKELEDSVLRGIRDQQAGSNLASGGDAASMLEARHNVSAQGALDIIASPSAGANPGDGAVFGSDTATEQSLRDVAARRAGLDWTDELGSVWDQGPLGATYRAVTSGVDWKATPKGWTYDPKQWERSDYSPEELEEVRAASWSPDALNNAASNITTRRYTQQVQSDMTPWQQIASGVVGGFTDPVGAAAGFGVGVGFRVAGVGATQLFQQGRVGAGILAAGAEGAAGNVAADTIMQAAGERRTVGDYLTDAAFGVGFGILGAHGDIIRGASRRHFEAMANDLHAAGVKERETASADAVDDGVNAPAFDGANVKAHDRWAEAGMQTVPEPDRVMPRPDVGNEESMADSFGKLDEPAPVEAAPVRDFNPAPEFATVRDGKTYDSRIIDSYHKSIEAGHVEPLLKTIASIPEIPEDWRALAAKLAQTAKKSGPKVLTPEDATDMLGTAPAGAAGLYRSGDHSIHLMNFKPDIALHEVIHAYTYNKLREATPEMQAIRENLGELLQHVNEHVANLDRSALSEASLRRINQPVAGPLANVDELLAYGFTDRHTQDILKSIPALFETGGKKSAWQWFKDTVARVLGLEGNTRTALDDLLEHGGDILSETAGPKRPAGFSAGPTSAPKTAALVNAHMADPARRAEIYSKYDLTNQISDNAMRIQVGEWLSRAEGIAAKYPVDPKKIKTILPGLLRSDSDTLGMESSVAAKAFALMFTENGQGAWERINHNAAIDMRTRQMAYEGIAPRTYNDAFNMWMSEQKSSKFGDVLKGGKQRREFARQLSFYRESIYLGKEIEVHPQIKRVSDAFDERYNAAKADGRLAKITGWAALDEEYIRGYGTRHWAGEKIASVSATRRDTLISAVEGDLRDRMEFKDETPGFVRRLAVQYFERISEQHSKIHRSDSITSNFNNADILRDSLKAMGLSEQEVQKNLDRFVRGGAKFTKGRYDLDVTATHTDAEGSFTLHDYMAADPAKDFKRYMARMSGEVSGARHGLMGAAGIDVARTALRVSGTSFKGMEAFDRVSKRYIGQMAGDRNPDLLQAINNWSTASMMGGGIYNQLGEYLNAIPTVGLGGVAKAAGLVPQMRKAVKARLAGEEVHDNILSGLEEVGGAKFGFGDYDMYAGPDLEEEQMFHGPEGAGILTKIGARAAHAQHVWTGQRLARAAQTRGLTKVMVEQVLSALKHGRDMSKGLKDIGLTDELIAGMKSSLDDVTSWKQDGTLNEFDPRMATSSEHDKTWANFYSAVQRGANQMIQGEFVGETGEWASKPLIRFMLKFRTFSLIAHQKQLGRIANVYGAGPAAVMTLGAMGLAVPLYAARTLAASALMSPDERDKFLKERLSPLAMGRATMNYVSTTGLLGDMLDLTSGVVGGWYESALGKQLPAWAKPTGGRTGARTDLVGGSFGPGIGYVNDAAKFLSGNGRSGLSVLPFGRMPYVMPFYQGLQSTIKEKGASAGPSAY